MSMTMMSHNGTFLHSKRLRPLKSAPKVATFRQTRFSEHAHSIRFVISANQAGHIWREVRQWRPSCVAPAKRSLFFELTNMITASGQNNGWRLVEFTNLNIQLQRTQVNRILNRTRQVSTNNGFLTLQGKRTSVFSTTKKQLFLVFRYQLKSHATLSKRSICDKLSDSHNGD